MHSIQISGFAILVMFTSGAWSQTTQNVVFRCVDDSGRPQYTNVRADTVGRQCQVVQKEVMVVPSATLVKPQLALASERPGASAASSTANPSRVDRETQKGRDSSRRKILEDELVQEQQLLTHAKSALAQQEGVRNADERNYQRVLDRLKPYQEVVDRHSRNVEALTKEISSTR
jgi:hypothetical protein